MTPQQLLAEACDYWMHRPWWVYACLFLAPWVSFGVAALWPS